MSVYSSRIPTAKLNSSFPIFQTDKTNTEIIILLLVLLVLIREKADTKLILAIVYIMI